VLDARSAPGGGVASEELLLPGFRLDSCSTGHTLIQTNPVLANDELGLIAGHGLTYIEPDPVGHVVFPDGESLTMWLDLERTCEELARFSPADAHAYRRLLSEYDAVKDVFARQRFTPAGLGPSFAEMLDGRPGAGRWMRRAAMSAWDVVRYEFESRHVQSFMLWMAFQTGQPVDSAGSGPLAYSIVFGRQRRSWTLPRGGSGELARALVEVIEDGGGEVLCDRRVVSLVLDGGRCIGVRTADGEDHIAREAVLSTIHVKDLVTMAPAAAWGEDFLYGVDTYDAGIAAFAAHYATTEPPRYAAHDGTELTVVSAGVSGWPEDILRMGRDVKEGRLVRDGSWLLFPTPTVADPSRAPDGHHTVKILGMQPYDPGGGPGQWARLRDEIAAVHLGHLRRAAPNLVDETILAELIVSPVDLERSNPHMWHGTFHGGDRSLAYSGSLRPAPGWAQHRMPIAGLYQTGGTTHPGGSVTGGPGRNAAIVMLTDLGDDPEEAMSRAPQAHAGRP
jgi:phytoene dehydrogenase-like protein